MSETNPVRPKSIPNLEINPADEGYIIYQAEQDRVFYLNPTAVLILERCNGERSIQEIAALLKDGYGLAEGPVAAVAETVEKLGAEGLLVLPCNLP